MQGDALILALNETRRTLLASRLCVAHSPNGGTRGPREPIRPGDAVWLEACSRVDLSGMPASLDLLFLDSDQRVLAAFSEFSPRGRYAEVAGAASVLELAAGTIVLTSTRKGDRIVLEPIVPDPSESREAASRG